jgi:hypothetical protein
VVGLASRLPDRATSVLPESVADPQLPRMQAVDPAIQRALHGSTGIIRTICPGMTA